MMSKQLLIVLSAVLACGQLVCCHNEDGYYTPQQQVDYAGLNEQPLNYNAPVVQPGQSLPSGQMRHSVLSHVKNLAGVAGQNARQTLKDAQPALLGLKSDFNSARERVKLSPVVVKVKDSLPTAETIKRTTSPIIARGQEKLNRLRTDVKNWRNTRYESRQQQPLADRHFVDQLNQPAPGYQQQQQPEAHENY